MTKTELVAAIATILKSYDSTRPDADRARRAATIDCVAAFLKIDETSRLGEIVDRLEAEGFSKGSQASQLVEEFAPDAPEGLRLALFEGIVVHDVTGEPVRNLVVSELTDLDPDEKPGRVRGRFELTWKTAPELTEAVTVWNRLFAERVE